MLIIALTIFTNCQQEIMASRQNLMAITPSSNNLFVPTSNTTSFKQITCIYNGKHQSSFFDLKRCNNETSSCYHYLIEEKKATDFTIINWLYKGMEVEISGKGNYQNKAKDKVYFELQDNIQLSIIAQYQGLKKSLNKTDKQYLVFLAKSKTTNTSIYFLLDSQKIGTINPKLKGLPKNTIVKISGHTQGLGVLAGKQYVELISQINVRL